MPNPSGATKPSLEKRLPLALALMMLVLLVSQYIFKPAPGPKPVKPINDNAAARVVEKPAAAPETAAAVTHQPAGIAGQVQGTSEVVTDIDTDLYHVILSNKGAAVESWVLKKYQDETGKPLQLIDTAAKDVPPPFSIEITGAKPSFDPNAVLYRATPASETEQESRMNIRMERQLSASPSSSAKTVIFRRSNQK